MILASESDVLGNSDSLFLQERSDLHSGLVLHPCKHFGHLKLFIRNCRIPLKIISDTLQEAARGQIEIEKTLIKSMSTIFIGRDLAIT